MVCGLKLNNLKTQIGFEVGAVLGNIFFIVCDKKRMNDLFSENFDFINQCVNNTGDLQVQV